MQKSTFVHSIHINNKSPFDMWSKHDKASAFVCVKSIGICQINNECVNSSSCLRNYTQLKSKKW